MPVSDLHRQVAAVALAAAAEQGFALGGGNALLAHGVISRPTRCRRPEAASAWPRDVRLYRTSRPGRPRRTVPALPPVSSGR